MAEYREPKKGDVIWADRMDKGRPYYHCGIYEGGGYVIHFAAPEGSEISQKNAVVHRTTLADFKDGCKLRIVEFPHGFSAEETVRRAQSRIGEKDYNFAVNNCDHFATWCKTDEHRSVQADEAKKVITVLGGITGEIICAAHDIAEDFKAPALNSIDMIQKPKEISEGLEQNAILTTVIPPVADEIDTSQDVPEYKIIDEEPDATSEDEGETGEDDLPPAKKSWYEKVGDKLKDLTFPIAGALEVLKRLKKLPPVLNLINYHALGAKVRNVIDNVVTKIKVFTGKLTPAQAREEIANNETALLGEVVSAEQKTPVREAVRRVFGGVGSVIKHIAQQAVVRFVPQPVRTAIKTGFQKVGHSVVSGFKAVAGKVGGFFKSVVGIFTGRR
jgi:hypothetical protein